VSKQADNQTPESYLYSVGSAPQTSHRLPQSGSTARTYDNNGNSSQIGFRSYSYDARNRMEKSFPSMNPNLTNVTRYQYNGRG